MRHEYVARKIDDGWIVISEYDNSHLSRSEYHYSTELEALIAINVATAKLIEVLQGHLAEEAD